MHRLTRTAHRPLAREREREIGQIRDRPQSHVMFRKYSKKAPRIFFYQAPNTLSPALHQCMNYGGDSVQWRFRVHPKARSPSSSLRKKVERDSKVATKSETGMDARAAKFFTFNLNALSCLFFGMNPSSFT